MAPTRRQVIASIPLLALGPRTRANRPTIAPERDVRFAALADLHHGLAPDAIDRLTTVVEAIEADRERSRSSGTRDLDFVIQLGDFLHAGRDHAECIELYRRLDLPRHHVLGNHDMDTCTKADAVRALAMRERHDAFVVGGWRFLLCDLNHIRDGEKRLDYANANFYIDAERRGWMDLAQLDWLERQIATSPEPVVVISHQPITPFGREPSPAQTEILKRIRRADRDARGPGLAALLCGHLHIDHLVHLDDAPSLCINSASYHWAGGMIPYDAPLHTIVTLTRAGELRIEACAGDWAPDADRAAIPVDREGVSPRIDARRERLGSA